MKTVLFIPGYQEDIDSRDYKSTIKAIESKGYKVKFVSIKWNRATIDDWLLEFNKTYEKYDQKTVILAGFSFGAMVAFLVASQNNPYELWLFSLSSYFKEDAPNWKKSYYSILGHRRISAFKKYSFNKLAKLVQCKTLLFVGEIEAKKYHDLYNRAISANKIIINSKLIEVPNSDHNVSDLNYINSIVENI